MPIYKSNKKTKDGRTWYYRCYYTDIYGNRKQKESKLYATKREAIDAEITFLKKNQTESVIVTTILFKDVYNEWLDYKKQLVKSSTFYSIKKLCNKHILSFFEKFKLHSIKINQLQYWKKHILSCNYTAKHNNTIIGYLQEILKYAINNYDFDIKVASKLQKNKIEQVTKLTDAEKNFWTFGEWKNFINIVDDEFYYILFNFMYFTGLRFGELSALNWNDLNFVNKTLKINKTLVTKIEGNDYIITTPKTENSNRIIDIDDNLIKLLKKYKEKEEMTVNFNNDMFIFGNIKHLSATTVRRYLDKYIKIADVKHITLHGFRHSHVSFLADIGCDIRDIAERIGDTVNMVEHTYYHMFPDKKSNTVSAINGFNKINIDENKR